MIIENNNIVQEPESNFIIGNMPSFDDGTTITFNGHGNILFAEQNVTLSNSNITFCGDNAVLYLSESGKHEFHLQLDLWSETTTFFGSNNYFNGNLTAIVSERKNLIVGDGGAFSFGIWIRTADPHLIYDVDSKRRTNMSKSVLIGDHVWLGQNSLILKGSTIGSGSIISAACVVANKRVESNTIYAGNPARKIRENVFFIRRSVHNYTAEKTEKSMVNTTEKFIFGTAGKSLDYESIDNALTEASSSEDRLKIVQQRIAACKDKDRFSIKEEKKRIRLFKSAR